MKRIFYVFAFLLICTVGHATHNRAGQLLYRHISGYTYEFTQVQFFYTLSPATAQRIRDGLEVTWGDNSESKIPCVDVETLPDNYTAMGIDDTGKTVNISNTQRYKCVGNGWTVDVIAHILGFAGLGGDA